MQVITTFILALTTTIVTGVDVSQYPIKGPVTSCAVKNTCNPSESQVSYTLTAGVSVGTTSCGGDTLALWLYAQGTAYSAVFCPAPKSAIHQNKLIKRDAQPGGINIGIGIGLGIDVEIIIGGRSKPPSTWTQQPAPYVTESKKPVSCYYAKQVTETLVILWFGWVDQAGNVVLCSYQKIGKAQSDLDTCVVTC